MRESIIGGFRRRALQEMAKIAPGATTIRVALHRARGVKIGAGVWIGYGAVLETAHPELIELQDGVSIGIRATIIAHFRETTGVVIERDAFIGPGVIVLPNVVIGRGAVITAGSVVNRSIPPMTLAQGNPAVPIAQCGIALTPDVTLKEFSRRLKPLAARSSGGRAEVGETGG